MLTNFTQEAKSHWTPNDDDDQMPGQREKAQPIYFASKAKLNAEAMKEFGLGDNQEGDDMNEKNMGG